ncbi:MAG TPA: S41 family peptidase, partial [Herpetosiphonaceae bacterium]|nr:S41 family peptidase [Herpetosiphonaceae bacterium]
MRFVGHTFGLILDLRQNTGGASTGVAFLCSYLFPPEPVHLNDIYYREGERVQQYWTLPALPGPRYGPGPVYVLTSRRTFSAGEELAYNLQSLGRATVVGEVTAGGANPVDVYQVHPHFAIRVPTCRAINPITRTNWEGVGVQPDLAVAAGDALDAAYREALLKAAAHYAAHATPAFKSLRQQIDQALSALDEGGLAAITA